MFSTFLDVISDFYLLIILFNLFVMTIQRQYGYFLDFNAHDLDADFKHTYGNIWSITVFYLYSCVDIVMSFLT